MVAIPLLTATLALAAPVQPAKPEVEKPTLIVSVATPKVHGVQEIKFDAADSTLSVVVTNVSDQPVRLWRDWCSWGYYNLTLEFADENAAGGEKTWVLAKKERGWSKNYPDAAEIAPGGSMIFTVPLTATTWKGSDFLQKYVGKKLKMRVNYAIPADADTKKLGVWTGRVQSKYQEYTIR